MAQRSGRACGLALGGALRLAAAPRAAAPGARAFASSGGEWPTLSTRSQSYRDALAALRLLPHRTHVSPIWSAHGFFLLPETALLRGQGDLPPPPPPPYPDEGEAEAEAEAAAGPEAGAAAAVMARAAAAAGAAAAPPRAPGRRRGGAALPPQRAPRDAQRARKARRPV
ncbi:hypothetical protein Rsub_10574 [Raphidocelis subcapitata]|uniref:Uncharacterized protein n=1 Tax=Raphidocelis subcapitata TaxID=307507 RepID=A0A2V0PGM6_9CHLO|nr:hypothetical protein Rsub_10574 [Raphidocelis subcapitata]|eukprot:GBF98162.1 hypothetical protein Rsub_10574 [Raphidocelis subcapitata]